MEVKIHQDDVCWYYTDHKDNSGSEWIFEESQAIAYLLATEILLSNRPWWDKTLTKKQQQLTTLAVLCNDVFAWGCADAEDIDYDDLEDLWNYYVKDPVNGPIVWCIIKRKSMPQKPVYDDIQNAGIWDLNKIKGLEPNYYDAMCKENAERRKLKKAIGM